MTPTRVSSWRTRMALAGPVAPTMNSGRRVANGDDDEEKEADKNVQLDADNRVDEPPQATWSASSLSEGFPSGCC